MQVYQRLNLEDRILPKSSMKTNAVEQVVQNPKQCETELSDKLS